MKSSGNRLALFGPMLLLQFAGTGQWFPQCASFKTSLVATDGQGLCEITNQVLRVMKGSGIVTGQLTLFIRHTSASLMIQENADPEVRRDLFEFFRRTVPEGASWIKGELGCFNAVAPDGLIGASEIAKAG